MYRKGRMRYPLEEAAAVSVRDVDVIRWTRRAVPRMENSLTCERTPGCDH
jgi:hypothetical protein